MGYPAELPTSRTPARIRAFVAFVLSGFTGWILWAQSPSLFGSSEPWDASLGGYQATVFAVTFLLSSLSPRHFWSTAVGLYLGQLGYCAMHANPPALIIIVSISLAFFCLPFALAGGGAALGLRYLFASLRRAAPANSVDHHA